ncbi:ShET2/EspL2 family type III secretion system effector toxin [Cupriavidus sp. H18C1]
MTRRTDTLSPGSQPWRMRPCHSTSNCPSFRPPVQCQDLKELRNRHVREWARTGGGVLVLGDRHHRITRQYGKLTVASSSPYLDPQQAAVEKTLRRLRRDVRKEVCHYCFHGNAYVRLNGAARSSIDEALITCGPLAGHWLASFLSPPEFKPDYETLRCPDAIRTNVGTVARAVHMAADAFCKIRIVEPDDWGKEFARQFRKMARHGEVVRGISLVLHTHVCAVGLKRKQAAGEDRVTYGIDFYDPNETATHRRIKYDELSDVESIVANRFLAPAALSWYSRDRGNAALMLSVGVVDMLSLRSASTLPRLSPRPLSGPLPDPSPAVLGFLIGSNCIEGMRRIAPALSALPDAQRIRCLGDHDKAPALYYAMQGGLPQTLTEYGALLEGLDDDTRAELLLARHPDGRTGLYAALALGRSALFRPYWELVKTLPDHWHYPLMRAANGKGGSALYEICETGQHDALEEMVYVMNDMPVQLRTQLLMAYSSEGDCGLAAAARAGHGRIIGLYWRALEKMPLRARYEVLRPVAASARCDPDAASLPTQAARSLRGALYELAPRLLLTPSFIVRALFTGLRDSDAAPSARSMQAAVG